MMTFTVVVCLDLESLSSQDAYVKSLYFIIETMTSTGYGDIHAHDALEMWLAGAIMVIGKMLFGMILATIASTLANQEVEQVKYEHMLEGVKVSAQHVKVNPGSVSKVAPNVFYKICI